VTQLQGEIDLPPIAFFLDDHCPVALLSREAIRLNERKAK